MDKYVNTDVGIYHIESVCDERDADGHKLYHAKCRYCEYENDMRLSTIKHATMCRHQNKVGNLLEFKPYWDSQRLRDIFGHIKDRCFNENNKDYCWYGGKGISVCQEWLDNPKLFEKWAIDNGYADNLTIDRINPDKNYTPDNCQWIPLKENTRKAGKVNWITVGHITLTGRQWAERLQVGVNTINRIANRYGIDKTIVLISKMLKEPITTKRTKPGQSLLEVYDIEI